MVQLAVESPQFDLYTYLESCAPAVPPLVLVYLYELNAVSKDTCRHSLNAAAAIAATGNEDRVLDALLHDSAKPAIAGPNIDDGIRALYPELHRENGQSGLTAKERAVIETHSFLSYEFNKILLEQIPSVDRHTAKRVAHLALVHHELPENQAVKMPYSRTRLRENDHRHVPLVMWIDQFLGPVERRPYKPTMMPVEQVIDRQVAIFAEDNPNLYRALITPIIQSLYLLFIEPLDTDQALDRMAHAAGIPKAHTDSLEIIPEIMTQIWKKDSVHKRYKQQIDYALKKEAQNIN